MSEKLIYLTSFVLVLSLVRTTVSASELPVTETRDCDEDGMQGDQGFMNLLTNRCSLFCGNHLSVLLRFGGRPRNQPCLTFTLTQSE
ncbi:hypothetical protein ACFL5Z_14260 [Planctomycetota bacterium]